MRQFFLNILVTKWYYALLVIIEIMLFIVYYYIISPSNFGSFSTTLRYYISALGTLLAVVVSFNTMAIQNQLKNMPTGIKSMNNQLDNIQNLLEPVFKKRKSRGENEREMGNSNDKKDDEDKNNSLEDASLYYSNAMKSIMIVVKDKAESYLNRDKLSKKEEGEGEDEFKYICTNVFEECASKLSSYNKTKSVYNLLTISTTKYIQKMKFNDYADDEKTKEFYQTFQKLHLLKSICYRIYIRNILTDLSYELLASAIPIITFIGLVSSISNYEDYNTLMIRVLFATSISVAAIPFLLLFTRVIPILHLIKEASAIPFARK